MNRPNFRKMLSTNPDLSESDIRAGESLLRDLWKKRDDDLGLILRAHLYLEAVLTELIQERLNEPDSLDLERLNFATKVDLAIALAVIHHSEKAPLAFLNKLRNRFAHHLDARLTEQDERQFVNSFAIEQRQEIQGGAHFFNTLPYLHGLLYGRLRRRR